MNYWLLAAATLSFSTCLIHLFAGGPSVAKPLLLSQDLNSEAKYTNYYCWHLVSAMLALMSLGFLLAALTPPDQSFAYGILWTVMAAFATLWSLLLIVTRRQSFLQLPHWLLFAPIAALAMIGQLR